MHEELADSAHYHLAPFTSFMSPGTQHANVYGPHGGLCLVIDFPADAMKHLLGRTLAETMGRRQILSRSGQEHVSLCSKLLLERAPLAPETIRDIAAPLACRQETGQTAPDWVDSATELIEVSDAPISVSALAEAYGTHRVHFTRSFKLRHGITPKRYQLDLQCLRALSDYVFDNVPLTEAALKAGFCDLSHNARETRKRTGAPPVQIANLLKD